MPKFIFIADKSGKGYTGYLARLPGLLAQGATKKETKAKLLVSLNDILKHYKLKKEFLSINMIDKDTNQHLISIPSLNITSYGDTPEEAYEMMRSNLSDFFDFLNDIL